MEKYFQLAKDFCLSKPKLFALLAGVFFLLVVVLFPFESGRTKAINFARSISTEKLNYPLTASFYEDKWQVTWLMDNTYRVNGRGKSSNGFGVPGVFYVNCLINLDEDEFFQTCEVR